jgi:hypothetical protein
MKKQRPSETIGLPHKNVYTRLQPSRVHPGGVGVFAIRKIKRGTHLFLGDNNEQMVWIARRKVAAAPVAIRRLYRDFAVLKNGRYGSPMNFDALTVAWYLNEPAGGEKPNVRCDPRTYEFFASRDIRAGEELTVDYSTYSEQPPSTELRKKRTDNRNGVAA